MAEEQRKVLMVGGRMDIRGTSRYTLNLATGLMELGWQVHLACGCGELLPEFQAAGAHVIPGHFPPNLLQLPFAARRLYRAAKSIEPDVIHVQTEDALPVAVAAFGHTDTPMFLTAHRVARRAAHMPRKYVRRLTAVIAVSDVVRADLVNKRRLPKASIVVIHNGVAAADGEPPRPAAGIHTPVVGTMGRLEKAKGIEDFLTAAAEVLKTKPDTFFLVAGDGPHRRVLRDLAIRLGIEKKICLAAAVPNHVHVLSSLDVLVVPSLEHGLGMAILEAMALGKPVIATARGGTYVAIRDGETGLLVPPGDPPALAKAIRTLLDDPDLRANLAAAAKEVVLRKFSIQAMVIQTDILYRREKEKGDRSS